MTDFEPIKGDADRWFTTIEEGVVKLDENNREEITNLLMGRKIDKIDGEHLLLDDGTLIKAIGHLGGCSCGAGDYMLTELNGVDNIITKVEYDYHPVGDDAPWGDDDSKTEAQLCEHAPQDDGSEGHYRIWVYAENQKINLMEFDGTDGNGYYGTGFEILVRPVS